jgi:hypothetical protein
MTFAFTLNLYTVLVLVIAILAIIDGIYRTRGRGGILPIVTIILAVLLGLSIFIAGIPLGTLALAILLLIALILVLIFRGSTRRGPVFITVIAIILDAVLILHNLGWLTIPGVF